MTFTTHFERLFTALRFRNLHFNGNKKLLIDRAFAHSSRRSSSFADLGGIWKVNGAYTFYALQNFEVEQAWLVDTHFSEASRRKSLGHPNLKLVESNFGDAAIAERIGEVDAVFLFDVLLHQVAPDWDELLSLYAKRTKQFLICNPQWTGPGETLRLLDLERDEYFRQIPGRVQQQLYRELFEKMHETHPTHNRPWRDVHHFWQWGITDQALIAKMRELGFEMTFYKNFGRFGSLPNFESHGFLFEASVAIIPA